MAMVRVQLADQTCSADLNRVIANSFSWSIAGWPSIGSSAASEKDVYQERIKDGASIFVATALGNACVALAALEPFRPGSLGKVTASCEIVVDPQFPFTNAAEILLDTVMKEAKSRGFKQLVVYVDSRDLTKVELLRSKKFLRCGEIVGGGVRFDCDVDISLFQRSLVDFQPSAESSERYEMDY
jgi:L-amino acid N-acyltransferase YncA